MKLISPKHTLYLYPCTDPWSSCAVTMKWLCANIHRIREGPGEREEAGRWEQHSQPPAVGLPRPNPVGQDAAVRWGQLPVGVHGPGGVPVGERHPRQHSPGRAGPAGSTERSGISACTPRHTFTQRGGPQQPRHHLGSHHHGSSDLPPQPRLSR